MFECLELTSHTLNWTSAFCVCLYAGSKVKETITKFFKPKGDRKKMKKKEKELIQRVSLLRRPAVIEADNASSCEDSNYDSVRKQDIGWEWLEIDSPSYSLSLCWQEDSDAESYTSSLQEDMMEFKLSFQMWLAGKWTVTVPNVSDSFIPSFNHTWVSKLSATVFPAQCYPRILLLAQATPLQILWTPVSNSVVSGGRITETSLKILS